MPGIGEQPVPVGRRVSGDLRWVETVEHLPVVLPLPENRDPAQTGLSAFENQHLEEPPVGVLRDTPFGVVVADVERVGAGPGTARGLRLQRRHSPLVAGRSPCASRVRACSTSRWKTNSESAVACSSVKL